MSVNGNTSSMKLNVVKSLHMITILAAHICMESLVVQPTFPLSTTYLLL